MEIRKNTDIIGVYATEDIREGLMVLLTAHPGVGDDLTGRLTDRPGVKLPDTPQEAAEARFVITWPANNVKPPIVSWPHYSYALRQAFDQAGNMPAQLNVYLTWPGNQECVVIPSGSQALAFDAGVFTVPSGMYVYDATMQTPGTKLRACDTSTDGAALAGMLAVVGGGTCVAIVEDFDTDTLDLTFRTYRLP